MYVHLGRAAVICTHQHHFKSAFGYRHSLLTRISLCVLALYSDKWKKRCSFPPEPNPQCQKKDKQGISVGAYVTLLIFLIEFIYLSSINNL